VLFGQIVRGDVVGGDEAHSALWADQGADEGLVWGLTESEVGSTQALSLGFDPVEGMKEVF
jgi:hypothetical protein